MFCTKCWERLCGEVQDRVAASFDVGTEARINAREGAKKFLEWQETREPGTTRRRDDRSKWDGWSRRPEWRDE